MSKTWKAQLEYNLLRWLRGPKSNLPIPGVHSALGTFWNKYVFKIPHRGLGLDEVYISPTYNGVVKSRKEPALKTRLTKGVETASPLQASNMQTVMTYSLANKLIETGHVPILHRYFGTFWQSKFLKKQPNKAFGCVGVRDPKEEAETAFKLLDKGALGICIETLHFDTWRGLEVLAKIKKVRPDAEVLVSNIVTYEATKRAINLGATGIKVGWGPGSPCTSRELAMGVPQATAIAACRAAAEPWDVPICADGGIKGSFQYNIAIALGAETAMMGQFFARTIESANGKLNPEDYPYNEASEDVQMVKKDPDKAPYGLLIEYFGEASEKAWRRANPEKEPTNIVFEGAGKWVPVDRDFKQVDTSLNGGLKTIMANVGARTISEFHKIVYQQALIHEATAGYHAERQTRFDKNAV